VICGRTDELGITLHKRLGSLRPLQGIKLLKDFQRRRPLSGYGGRSGPLLDFLLSVRRCYSFSIRNGGEVALALVQDFKFALRQLRRAKIFTTVAVLTVGLGIGCNTAIFSVFYGVLLRPLPFPDPGRLVLISEHTNRFSLLSASWENFSDWRLQSTSFQEFGAVRSLTMSLTGNGDPEQIPTQMVTGNLLHLLGVKPSLGRPVTEGDDQPSSRDVALLGYGLWQRKYSGSPNAVGQTIRLNDQTYTIIGVLPRNYEVLQQKPDVVVAMAPWARGLPDDRSWHPGIFPIARLKPGVSLQSARAEMTTIAKRLLAQHPTDNIALNAIVNPMHEQMVKDARPALFTLLGAVVFVLLIACGNIANLLLTRAAARRREISIRIALGASDWQIMRQLIIEGLLLSAMGAIAGTALAALSMPSLLRAAATSLPAGSDVRMDTHVLLFTVAVSICAGVVFGIVPAVHLRLVDLRSILNETERGAVGRQAKRLRSILVISEMSFALLLMIGAGLFVRSLDRLGAVSLGFSEDHILIAEIPMPPQPQKEPTRNADFFENVLHELHSMPGVNTAAAASFLPASGQGGAIHFNIFGHPPHNASEYIIANYRAVSSEYMQALRIPLIEGRWVTDADRETSPSVVVINQAMAHAFFGNQSPLGKKMQIGAIPENEIPWMTVVGVVGDMKQSLEADTPTEMYIPFRQFNQLLPVSTMSIVLRTEVDPHSLVSGLRETVKRVNPNQPVVKIRTMEENVSQNFAQPRFRTMLLVIFASIAVLIAAIGVYGVMAYATLQRSGEIAIRMALGGSRDRIFALILADGIRLTLAGALIGTVIGLAVAQYLKSLLFGVSATDATTLGVSITVVLLAGLVASVIPARRASRVEITTLMREN
jgi:putative ABC transport system permease protein